MGSFKSGSWELRKQNGRAGQVQVQVFIHTSPLREHDKQYSRSITVRPRRSTVDIGLIATSAIRGLRAIFRPGFCYAKAGVMLRDLQHAGVVQCELDWDDPGEALHSRGTDRPTYSA